MTELPQTGEVLPPGAPPPPQAKTSGSAVASLIFGILTFCTLGLTAIPGLILGFVGLRSVRRGGGAVKGRGLAIAGIVTSAVGLCLWIIVCVPFALMAMFLTATMHRPLGPHVIALAEPNAEMAAQSMTAMKALVKAARAFAEDHRGRLPTAEEFPEALQSYLKGPMAPQGRAFALNEALAGVRLADIATPQRTVLLFEAEEGGDAVGGRELLRPLDDSEDGYLIGFVDGHVEWVSKEETGQLVWEPEKAEFIRL
ncbi:MAG: DUF4190 domain-containing protein [Planctomycetota bacterium]|nr:DUF4190 domain-containing protein [Planctomycetota bacterium]